MSMRQDSLFASSLQEPLANRMRPLKLDEYVGQRHLLAKGQILRQLIENDLVPSMIFWGPPGVGKTTLARIIAHQTSSAFINFSAVTSGIKEIREVMKQAQAAHRRRRSCAAARDGGPRTIVFVDEIHRFNKAQQDAFLPYVENGSIVLIGATTENPSFEINSALLSRCKVFVLRALGTADLTELLRRALRDERGFGRKPLRMEEGTVEMIAEFAAGDARTALNTLEMAVYNAVEEDGWLKVSVELIEQCTSRRSFLYDKKGEEHYNLISALHKSMRNSDVQAAVYWLARMLEAGEDPLYIARRLVRFASEDVGMADSRALEICVAAYQAAHFLGMPECSVHLTHAVTYLSLAPKSNALYRAYERAKDDAQKTMKEPVPLQIRNAVTKLMKELDYGKGYRYAHDEENAITDMVCLPECIQDHVYYEPSAYGSEEKVQRRMRQLEQLRRRK